MNRRSAKESKKKILGAATMVFSQYGYEGASMRTIAGAAGISIGGLYLHFKSKEGLYETLMRNMLDDLTEETRETLRDIQDPAAAMSTFISMRVKYARKNRGMILVLGREQTFTFGTKAKKKFFKDQRMIVEEIVRRGIASGRFRSCDDSEVAKIIICALRGLILSMMIEPDALFSPEECSALILKGILAKGRGTHRTG